ncbi:MAG: hypothetical protein H6713_41515 [Myxococcales bacterium]|nr:hypothetical protein [Myxococcales bacterium]
MGDLALEGELQRVDDLDSPRARALLVSYAERLLDAGDPRGPLAASQLRAGHDDEARAHLAAHAEALLGPAASDFEGEDAPLKGRWTGGWMTSLTIGTRCELPVAALSELLRRPALANLRELELRAPRQFEPALLEAMAGRASLRALRLTLHVYPGPGLHGIGELPRLRSLHATFARYRSWGLVAPQLRTIDIRRASADSITPLLDAARPVALEQLAFAATRDEEDADAGDAMASLLAHDRLATLRELRLYRAPGGDYELIRPYHPKPSDAELDALLRSPRLAQLARLDMSDITVGQEQHERVQALAADCPCALRLPNVDGWGALLSARAELERAQAQDARDAVEAAPEPATPRGSLARLRAWWRGRGE